MQKLLLHVNEEIKFLIVVNCFDFVVVCKNSYRVYFVFYYYHSVVVVACHTRSLRDTFQITAYPCMAVLRHLAWVTNFARARV